MSKKEKESVERPDKEKTKEKADSLVRLEIVMSQSIEEDFVTAFMKEETGRMFSKLPVVMGRGRTEPKMGDAIWPQLNCMYIVICTKEQASVVKMILRHLREEYPEEGLSCFKSKVKML